MPHHGGRVRSEDFAALITSETRLIVLSSTQWHNGFRADLPAFAELCRSHDMRLVVDVVQKLGAIRTEQAMDGIDFLIAGSLAASWSLANEIGIDHSRAAIRT